MYDKINSLQVTQIHISCIRIPVHIKTVVTKKSKKCLQENRPAESKASHIINEEIN